MDHVTPVTPTLEAAPRRGRILRAVELLFALAVEMSRGLRDQLSDRREAEINRTYHRVTKAFLLAQEFIRRIGEGWFGENCERFRPVEAEGLVEREQERERPERYFAGLPSGEWLQWSRPDNRFWRRPVEAVLLDICGQLEVKGTYATWLEQRYGLAARLAEVKALAEAAAAEAVAAKPKQVEWDARPIHRDSIEETWAQFREAVTGSRDPPA